MTSRGDQGSSGGPAGVTLAALANARWAPDAVAELAVQLCEALGDALRRDRAAGPFAAARRLGPASVRLDPEGAISGVDLGRGGPTAAGVVAVYDAPEALAGARPTPASHVFSIGTLVAEAALGERLFTASSLGIARAMVRDDTPGILARARVEQRVEDKVPGLGAIVARCLRADASERYAAPAELADALRALPGHRGTPSGALARLLRAQRAPTPPPRRPHVPPAASAPPDAQALEDALATGDVEPLDELKSALGFGEVGAPPKPRAVPGLDLEAELATGSASIVEEELPLGVGAGTTPPRPGADALADPALMTGEVDTAAARASFAPEPPPVPVRPPVHVPPLRTGKARAERKPTLERNPTPESPAPRTPVEPAASMADALKWFAVRAVAGGTGVGLLLLILLWGGFAPALTAAQSAHLWRVLPPGVPASLSAGAPARLAAWWPTRPASTALTSLGNSTLGVLPDDLRIRLETGPPEPEPIATLGSPTFEGGVISVEGFVTPGYETPGDRGALKLDVTIGERGRGELIEIAAWPSGEPRPIEEAGAEAEAQNAEGTEGVGAQHSTTADNPLLLPPGLWDVELAYSESPLSGVHIGQIHGIEVHAGLTSRLQVGMTAAVSFTSFQLLPLDPDPTPHVAVSAWPPNARTGEPAWSIPAGKRMALPAGPWWIVARLDNGKNRPTEAQLGVVDLPGDAGEHIERFALEPGEILNPTGPGLRVAAMNRGHEVSERTRIYIFSPGANPEHDLPIADGPAGRYFDAPSGTWDVQFVFVPSPSFPGFRGRGMARNLTIPRGGILKTHVDLRFDYAGLRVSATRQGQPFDDRIEVTAVPAGDAFPTADPAIEGPGGVLLPLAEGLWDVHLSWRSRSGSKRHKVFPSITLRPGDLWEQAFELDTPQWVARPTKAVGAP